MTATEQADQVRRAAKALADAVQANVDDSFDVAGLVALWRDCKEAANALYATCKRLEPHILAADPDSRGWHNEGRPVEVKRRFEIELLNHETFNDWLASRPEKDRWGAEVEWTPKLNGQARKVVQAALLDDGEKPDGVSAGYGAAFLSLGKRS